MSTHTTRNWLRIALIGFVAAALAACAPASPAASVETAAETTVSEPVQLRIGVMGDESTLTPYTYVTGYPGWNLLLLQYDTLYQTDVDGMAQPWLARGLSVSENGLTVTIDLRDDVSWHDGEPFSAGDVKFTVDYFKAHTQSRFTRALAPVESAEVAGEHQVVLTLTAPTPLFELSVLADVPIMPEHIWANIEDPAAHAFESASNVGTGPYRLVEYRPDQYYRFTANPEYFAGAPAVAEITAIIYADDTGGLTALQTGEADMLARPVLPEQIALLSASRQINLAQGALFTTDMLTYDMTKFPFDRAEVRRAVSLAIDRQELIDTVYLGAATPGSIGWIHPASPFFNEAVVTEYDPDQARALLDEAGIIDSDGDGIREAGGAPLKVEFLTPSGNALRLRTAEVVSEMLRNEIGVDAAVAVVEQATWEDAVWPGFDVAQGRNYDMAMWGWSAPVQANAVRITSLIHSDPAIGSLNLTGYASETADALAEALNVAVDPDKFADLLDQVQVQIATDLPFIMLLYPDGAYAYRADVYDGWAFMAGQGIFHKLSFLPESARP